MVRFYLALVKNPNRHNTTWTQHKHARTLVIIKRRAAPRRANARPLLLPTPPLCAFAQPGSTASLARGDDDPGGTNEGPL